jgi:hypothetical protein
MTTEFREWDWPPYPERHRAGRRADRPTLDLNIQVTQASARYRRPLRDRFRAGLARVAVGLVKIGLGAALGVAVVLVRREKMSDR